VGSLPWSVDDQKLKETFEPHGNVVSAKVVTDRSSGRSRGFGFVEMPNNNEAQAALTGITEIKGKGITINEAKPQTQRGSHGGAGRGPRDRGFDRRERRY